MDGFLNLGLFLIAFYLILLYAGWPDRRKTRTPRDIEAATSEKRVA